MPQTTRWRFDEFTAGHYTMEARRVKWFANEDYCGFLKSTIM